MPIKVASYPYQALYKVCMEILSLVMPCEIKAQKEFISQTTLHILDKESLSVYIHEG